MSDVKAEIASLEARIQELRESSRSQLVAERVACHRRIAEIGRELGVATRKPIVGTVGRSGHPSRMPAPGTQFRAIIDALAANGKMSTRQVRLAAKIRSASAANRYLRVLAGRGFVRPCPGESRGFTWELAK